MLVIHSKDMQNAFDCMYHVFPGFPPGESQKKKPGRKATYKNGCFLAVGMAVLVTRLAAYDGEIEE